jgi:hypothetical protein
MTKEEILNEIASLPPEARREIEDLIVVLRERQTPSPENGALAKDLRAEPFLGM